ncbi:MAG: hypothetical protein Q3983_09735 [Capnocytophaga sp.]|nr:hypothetical protein [Capnocytophaga sp.]
MIPLQQNISEIQEKIANAPDNGYAIGILIGSLLPFAVLAILGYLLISYMKNKHNSK